MLLLEITAVIGAYIVLIMIGVAMARKAIGFGKSVRQVMMDIEPKTSSIQEQIDSSQRRSLSIVKSKSLLSSKVFGLRSQLSKLRVVFSAASEAWGRVAEALNYVGL